MDLHAVSGWTNTIFLSLNGMLRPSLPELVSSLVSNIDEANWSIRVLFSVLYVYVLLIIVEVWRVLFNFMILVYLTSKDVLILMRYYKVEFSIRLRTNKQCFPFCCDDILMYGRQPYIKYRT